MEWYGSRGGAFSNRSTQMAAVFLKEGRYTCVCVCVNHHKPVAVVVDWLVVMVVGCGAAAAAAAEQGQAMRGERALALAGVECAAGPHERFPRVALDTAPDEVHLAQRVLRIVLACGTKGAQPRKHVRCLHIIAARHRASGQPSASGADDRHSRRKYPGERAAAPAVGQHMQGQRVAALGRSDEPHRGLGRCLLASAAKATGRLRR
jgi:hypothetical protein